MDDRLTSLSGFFAIPGDAERSASFAEFVGQVKDDIQAAIESHKGWWLIDGETLPPDIKEVVLLHCVAHFSSVRELERRIPQDNRALGVKEATWLPYLAANAQPVVQKECRTHPTLADSAAVISQISNDLMDAVKEGLEQLSRAFREPQTSSDTSADLDSQAACAQSTEPARGQSLPSDDAIHELYEKLVSRLKQPGLSRDDAHDRVAGRICSALAKIARADGDSIRDFAAYVVNGVMKFDRNDHWRELDQVKDGRRQLQARFSEHTSAAPEDEPIYQELRSLILEYTAQLPEREREIFVAWACDKFRLQQICEKLFHRLGTLETSRDVWKWKRDREAHFKAMLTKHGYEVPTDPRKRSSASGSH